MLVIVDGEMDKNKHRLNLKLKYFRVFSHQIVQ